MKFTIEIDPETNPDAVGEYLRSAFFDEKIIVVKEYEDYRETGCYSTFDWQEGVEPLEEIRQEEFTCDGCRKSTPHSTQGGMNSTNYVCTCTHEAVWTRGRKLVCTVGEPVSIECRWYWDGDGELTFTLPGGAVLVNDDCKKDHDWCLYSSWEEYEGRTWSFT